MSIMLQLHFPSSNRSPIKLSSKKEVIVGRAPTADVKLPEYDTVSRRHLKIVYENGHYNINDLGSTNGTSVNGYPLTAGDARILRDGDRIQIANEPELLTVVRISQEDDSDDTKPIPTDPMWLLLLDELQQYRDVMLLGIAGMGKTTLLRKLIPQRRTQHIFDKFWPAHRSLLFCRVDGMAISDTTLSSFFQLLIATTKPAFEQWPDEIREAHEWLSTGNRSIAEIRAAIVTTIEVVHRDLGKRVVFLLDHFDDIYPNLPSELFWVLKELKSLQRPVLYVIAMRNEFDGTNPNIHQFLRAIHPPNYHWLPPMRPLKLKKVIAPYRLPAKKVEKSIELGGQQPRLTELVANALQHIPVIPNQDHKLIQRLLSDNVVNDHCREIWDSLSSQEQNGLLSVAKGQPMMSYRVERELSERKMLLIGEGDALRVQNRLFAAYIFSRQTRRSQPKPVLAPEPKPKREPPPPPRLVLPSEPKPEPKPEPRRPVFQEPTVRASSGEEIKTDGHPILRTHLTELEEKLLMYMYAKAGEVCTHDEIITHIWGYDPSDPTSQASISNLIRNLRKKLNKISSGAGRRYIKNIRGRGYIYVKSE
ncbi:MAG: FHA domain-containing protein [Ardenticatenaceae bacterium]